MNGSGITGVRMMGIVLLGSLMGFLRGDAAHIQTLIKNSDAVGVLVTMKTLERPELEIAAELAHETLAKRQKLRRSGGEWFAAVTSFLGLGCVAGLELLYRYRNEVNDSLVNEWRKPRVPEELFEYGHEISYIIPPFLLALFYGYWWRGPRLRLERAKIIADAFDLELGVTKDRCEA